MSLLIRIMAAVPKLAKQDCGGATEEPSCARCTNSPWEHWSWSLVLIVKFVCNLSLWTCWIPERMLNQPAANRAGVIASPPSHDWFIPLNITCFPLACAGRHRVKESCTIVCPRAENPFSFFFLIRKYWRETSYFTDSKASIELTEPSSMKKADMDIIFSLIHFEFACKCLGQVLWELSKISTR